MRIRNWGVLAILLAVCGSLQSAPKPIGDLASFQKFRERHKDTLRLRRAVTFGLENVERAPGMALLPSQAHQLLTVLNPLRGYRKLTQARAKSSQDRVIKILSRRQRAIVDNILNPANPFPTVPRRGPQTIRKPKPNRKAPAPPSPELAAAMRKLKDFNPFRPTKAMTDYEQEVKINTRLFHFLRQRAKGGKETYRVRSR